MNVKCAQNGTPCSVLEGKLLFESTRKEIESHSLMLDVAMNEALEHQDNWVILMKPSDS